MGIRVDKEMLEEYIKWTNAKQIMKSAAIMAFILLTSMIIGLWITTELWAMFGGLDIAQIGIVMTMLHVILLIINGIVFIVSLVVSIIVCRTAGITRGEYSRLNAADKKIIKTNTRCGYIYALIVLMLSIDITVFGNACMVEASPYDKTERIEICQKVEKKLTDFDGVRIISLSPHMDYINAYKNSEELTIYFDIDYEIESNKLDSSNFYQYASYDPAQYSAEDIIKLFRDNFEALPDSMFDENDFCYLTGSLEAFLHDVKNVQDNMQKELDVDYYVDIHNGEDTVRVYYHVYGYNGEYSDMITVSVSGYYWN